MYKILGADQKEYGPVGAEEIRQWIAQGRANAQTFAQAEGATEWRPLNAFPEFAASLATVAAPVPFATHPMGSGASAHTNGLAIAGFVLGLLSLICCFIAPAFSALGLIFSIVALVQINHHPFQGGKGLAIAGIILSVFGFLLFGFFMLMGALGPIMQEVS